jgi:hypothetical protein
MYKCATDFLPLVVVSFGLFACGTDVSTEGRAGSAGEGPDSSKCGGCSEGFGPCEPCEDANAGDPCNAVGYRCPNGGGGNCRSDFECGGDHTWQWSGEPGCCI